MANSVNIYEYALLGQKPHTLTCSLPYFREQLAGTNPALFSYLQPDQRDQLRSRLFTTLALLRFEAQEHMQRKRIPKLTATCGEISTCLAYLGDLDPAAPPVLGSEQKPAKYLGLTAALSMNGLRGMQDKPTLLGEPADLTDDEASVENFKAEAAEFVTLLNRLQGANALGQQDTVDKIRQHIGTFNNIRREQWVWGSIMYGAVFDQLAADLIHLPNESNLKQGMDSVSLTTGLISGFLYLYRLFFVELWDAVREARNKWKPLANHPQYIHEKNAPATRFKDKGEAWARFCDDLINRKFIILNDFLWGGVNTFCFILGLMKGSDATFLINALTVVFLISDVILTVWRFIQQRKEYQDKLNAIKDKLKQMEATETEGLEEDAKNHLKHGIEDLQKAKKNLEREWPYQQYKLWADLTYTVGLVVAWSLTCAFFFGHIAGYLVMGIVGSVTLFVMTLAYNFINGVIEHNRIQASADARLAEARACQNTLKDELQKDSQERSDILIKYNYLQIKTLLAHSEHERALARFELKKAGLYGFLSALSPVVFFASFAFLQLSFAILAVAVFLVVIYALRTLLAKVAPTRPPDFHFFPRLEGERTNEFDRELEKHLAMNTPFEIDEKTGKFKPPVSGASTLSPALPISDDFHIEGDPESPRALDP